MRQAPLAISIVLVFVLLCLIEIATVITSTINIIMLASYGTGWRWHESCATSTNIRAAEPTYYRRDWAGSFTKVSAVRHTSKQTSNGRASQRKVQLPKPVLCRSSQCRVTV